MSKFFLLHPEFNEPYKMIGPTKSSHKVFGGRIVQPWLSKEDYLSVQTLTQGALQFLVPLLNEQNSRK